MSSILKNILFHRVQDDDIWLRLYEEMHRLLNKHDIESHDHCERPLEISENLWWNVWEKRKFNSMKIDHSYWMWEGWRVRSWGLRARSWRIRTRGPSELTAQLTSTKSKVISNFPQETTDVLWVVNVFLNVLKPNLIWVIESHEEGKQVLIRELEVMKHWYIVKTRNEYD